MASKEEVKNEMTKLFTECMALREQGQKEYAHEEENALKNFYEVSQELGISPEVALLTYASKHWRGILADAKGHRSQREEVHGRIKDLIVYLCLYSVMRKEQDNEQQSVNVGP